MQHSMSHDIEAIIARAIKNADTSYFFEDYRKQSRAVVSALKKAGISLVVHPPTEEMLKAGVEAIPSGRVKPETVAERIYSAMVQFKSR
jgi:hypothetical protein